MPKRDQNDEGYIPGTPFLQLAQQLLAVDQHNTQMHMQEQQLHAHLSALKLQANEHGLDFDQQGNISPLAPNVIAARAAASGQAAFQQQMAAANAQPQQFPAVLNQDQTAQAAGPMQGRNPDAMESVAANMQRALPPRQGYAEKNTGEEMVRIPGVGFVPRSMAQQVEQKKYGEKWVEEMVQTPEGQVLPRGVAETERFRQKLKDESESNAEKRIGLREENKNKEQIRKHRGKLEGALSGLMALDGKSGQMDDATKAALAANPQFSMFMEDTKNNVERSRDLFHAQLNDALSNLQDLSPEEAKKIQDERPEIAKYISTYKGGSLGQGPRDQAEIAKDTAPKSKYKVGDEVTVKGKKVKIKKIIGDKFEY